MKNFKRNVDGITLIALVVTIIVLLILAGVTIAMLTGENGILGRAGQASETTKDMSEDEQVKLAVADALVDGTGTLSADNLTKAFKNEFGTEKVPDDTFSGDGPWTFKGERKTYTIETNGKVTSGDTTTPSTEKKLAKEVLQINPSATNDYEKSPYVKYNNILCRVFYSDGYEDGNHGLQIISADNMEKKVKLGYEDDKVTSPDFNYEGNDVIDENFKRAATSYNRAVDTLNNEANTYKDNSGIVIDARSLGSIATLKDGKFQLEDNSHMYPSESDDPPIFMNSHGWINKFKNTDTNYEEDAKDNVYGQLQKLGLNATTDTWLASRSLGANSLIQSASISVRCVRSDGVVSYEILNRSNYLRNDRLCSNLWS